MPLRHSMELELNLEGRKALVKELSRDGSKLTIAVDDETYVVDIVKVGPAEYSLLYKGRSYNIEVVPGREPKHFTVNTFYFTNEIEVVDAETRYIRSRKYQQYHPLTHAGENCKNSCCSWRYRRSGSNRYNCVGYENGE